MLNLEPIGKSTLLSFGETRVLIDFALDTDEASRRGDAFFETLNLVLFTHANAAHLGAYALACKLYPALAAVPAYGTLPVINMGRIATLEAYRSAGLLAPDHITATEIEIIFDNITSIKYLQPIGIGVKSRGEVTAAAEDGDSTALTTTQVTTHETLTITAFNSGHSLGGTIWRLQHQQDNVVYAVDWNHAKDSHLSGAAFLQKGGQIVEALHRPTVMVCGSQTGLRLKRRDILLWSSIQQALKRGGSVMIPTSVGSRVLEVIHMLDDLWTNNQNPQSGVTLVLLSHLGARLLNYASSMLEWMSPGIIAEWEKKNESPFQTRNFKIVHSMDQFEKVTKGGTGQFVVVTVGEDLESGFSRLLFNKFASDARNSIVFTEKVEGGSLATNLQEKWETGQEKGERAVKMDFEETLKMPTYTPLSEAEMKQYRSTVEGQQKDLQMAKAMELRNKELLEEAEAEEMMDSSDDEDVSRMQGSGQEYGFLHGGVLDVDVREAVGAMRNFPFYQKRQRVSEYGVPIHPSDFARIEERPEVAWKERDRNEVDTDEPRKRQRRRKQAQEEEDVVEDADDAPETITSLDNQPIRVTYTDTQVSISCFVDYVDLSGRIDERSLGMIMHSIRPKKLLLLDDSRQADHLCSYLQREDQTDVHVLRGLTTAGTHSFAVDIQITSELSRLLNWQQLSGGLSLAHVVGKVAKNERQLEDAPIAALALAPIVDAADLAVAPRVEPLRVGDIRLAELKQALGKLGHRAVFQAGGILVVDDKVSVRKVDESNIVVDGGIGRDFYAIKDVVRAQLAQIG